MYQLVSFAFVDAVAESDGFRAVVECDATVTVARTTALLWLKTQVTVRIRASPQRCRKSFIIDGPCSVCVRTSFRTIQWNRLSQKCRPGGAFDLKPALKRWEKRKKRFKSRRDD